LRKFKFVVQHDIIIEAADHAEAARRLARLELTRPLGAEIDADEQTVTTGGRMVANGPTMVAGVAEL